MTQQQQTQENQAQSIANSSRAMAPRAPISADGRVVFRYIVGPDGRRTTIARRLVEQNGETVLQVGWSSCAPQDNFNRSLARTIATGRMNNERSRISAPLEAGKLANIGNRDLNAMAAGMLRNAVRSKLVQEALNEYIASQVSST